MKYYLSLIILVTIASKVFCQPPNYVGTLLNRMKTENDTTKVNTMNEIVSVYGNKGLFDSSDYYIHKVLELSQKINFPKGICSAYNGFGIAQMVKGAFKPALENYFKALSVAENNGLLSYITVIKRNIATVYIDQAKFKEAVPLLKEVLQAISGKRDSLRMFPILTEIGFCYAQQKMQDSASYFYNKGLFICNAVNYNRLPQDRAAEYIQAKSSMLPKAADFFVSIGKAADAIQLLLPFWDQIKATENAYNKLSILVSIDEVYLKTNDYNNVIKYADIGIAIDGNKEFQDELAPLYQMKAEASYKSGKFKEAYESQLNYTALNDSLYTGEKFKAIQEMQVKYDTEKKEQEIILLNKEEKTQKLITGLSITGLLVIIGLLAFVIRFNRLKQKLLIKKKEIERKGLEQEMAELEQTALRAQMNPHFIFNCLNSVQRYVMNKDTEGFNNYLSMFANLIRQTLENSGKALISLNEELLYLNTYVKLEQMRSENAFSYSITVAPTIDTLATFIPNMIIQPFIENCIQHGVKNARENKGAITVDLSKNDKQLVCTIEDNGEGIAKTTAQNEQPITHDPMGSSITKKRIDMYNLLQPEKIEINIEDKFEKDNATTGTLITLRFPLNH